MLENKYSGDDDTPFWVRRYLVNWKLTDYKVQGLDKLNLTALGEEQDVVHLILKDLSGKYQADGYGKGFLEARLTSSRSLYKYNSSIGRVLDRIEIRDNEEKGHRLKDFVFGDKFAALIPHHSFLLPFGTKGMRKFLKDLGLRDEPTQEELINAIGYMGGKVQRKGA
ncbi:hypothetical protein ES705_44279 [subsurface metagenome]